MEQPLTEEDLKPKPQVHGTIVSNPAWIPYIRKGTDVWEEPLDKAEDTNMCICGAKP